MKSYPLPLQLTQPVATASDLDTLLSSSFEGTYDHETQVRTPMNNGGGFNTNSQCVNFGLIQVDDVLQDIGL